MAVKNRLPYPPKNADGTDGKMPEALKSVDIRDTLNAYGGKCTNKTSSFFKPDANINKWSKHKPIVAGKAPEYIKFIPYYDEVWDNQDGSVPIRGVNDDRVRALAWQGSTEDEWMIYTPPTGGESQPFRKGDFRGYRADATSPFKSFDVDDVAGDTTQIGGKSSVFGIYIRYFLNNEDDEVEGGMISLSDLNIFDDKFNTHRVGVIDYFNEEYKLTTGDLISSNWGYAYVTIDWNEHSDIGTHELAAVLYTDNDNLIPLPFPRRKVKVLKYYGSETFLNTRASFAYTSDGSEGKFDIYYDYIRGNNQSEDTKFTVSIAYGTESSYIGQITIDTFTSPNSNANEAGDFIISRHLTFDQSNSLWSTWVRMANEGNLYAYINGERVDNTTI